MAGGDGKTFEEALTRGLSYAWNEEWEKAADEYRLALEQSPQDSLAKGYLAMALYRSGRLSESLEMYQVLWRAEPDNIAALSRITELQEKLGDRDAAAAGHRVLAELHVRQGAYEESLKSWQRAVQLRPDNLTFWDHLMDAAVQVGEVASALPGYLKAVSQAVQHGRLEDALPLAERARTLAPDAPEVVALLSEIRDAQGHPEGSTLESETSTLEEGATLELEEEATLEPVEMEPLPANVVRFHRHVEPADESHQVSQPTSPAVDTPPDAPSPPDDVPAREAERPAEEQDAKRTTSAAAGQEAIATSGRDLPALEPAEEIHAAAPEEVPTPGLLGAQQEEPTRSISPSELLNEAQVSSVVEAPEATEQRPEPQSAAPEAGQGEPLATTGEQDQPEAPPTRKAAVHPKNTYGWGAGSLDFGLAEDRTHEPPQPEAAPAAPHQSQPDVEPAARQQQSKGLFGRVFGFMWQPGENEQDQPEAPVLPDTSAGAESRKQMGTGGMDFGLAEVPRAAVQRPERSHYWGTKDFGLAEASGEGAGRGLVEANAGESVGEASPEAGMVAGSDPAGSAEAEGAREAKTGPVNDLMGEWISRAEAAEAALAVSAGGPSATDLVELAGLYLQRGKTERARESYRQALDADPDLPGALVGMARLLLASEQLDGARENARHALERSLPEADMGALELILEILREDAARGKLGSVAETVLWLRSSLDPTRLSPALSESLLGMPVELLGRTAGEHLEEVRLLPPEAREDCIAALQAAETYLRHGQLRSAADEMYGVLATYPDFLPAQSLLGRVLVAEGRIDEARDRVERLVGLYELRGEETRALGVLWWAVAQRVARGDARARLADLLRRQNRLEEAELIELGWVEPSSRSSASPIGGSVALHGRAATVPVPEPWGRREA